MNINEEIYKSISSNLIGNRGCLEEILWANIFHDSIIGSEWLRGQSFAPGRAAIGYPTLYALYRILDEFQPQRILEMGLGQSTKMISAYAKWKEKKNETCEHIVIEHDQSWIDFYTKKNEVSKNTKIFQLDLVQAYVPMENGEETSVNLYKDFGQRLGDKKYDLIFIDGPFGSPIYSRIDILDILPECLEKSFIIMLDDAQRQGEDNTVKMIKQAILNDGRKLAFGYYTGQKSTAIITSKNLHFYCTM